MRTMRTSRFIAAMALGMALDAAAESTLNDRQRAALARIERGLSYANFSRAAVPTWLMGDLGPAEGEPATAALGAVRQQAELFRLGSDDEFAVRTTERDDIGDVHVRLAQLHRGRPVIGGELIVHIRRQRVSGINGRFHPELRVPAAPRLSAADALERGRVAIGARDAKPLDEPQLVVFMVDDAAHLAWQQSVEYDSAHGYEQEMLFTDAGTGELLGRQGLIHTAKDRRIHEGAGICLGSGSALPGPLLVQEGGSLAGLDEASLDAYSGTGKTYDFYRYALSRDSYDGAGAPLVSSMHVGFGFNCSGNNAAWMSLKKQMVYGDGDGVSFTHLSNDVDVTAHELTHAVTSETAGLIYQKEPGALNEAFSDIFGEIVDRFQACPGWTIGENVYTPNTAGDALRYMDDPKKDGYSADYYPERLYAGACSPSSGNDYCGVHGNSGIANLAFKLLATGGSHPRGETSVVVPAIGIDAAGRIFYRALRHYMTSSADFADAREATVQAANTLASCATIKTAFANAVNAAWDAVGVPTNPPFAGAIWDDDIEVGPLNPCILIGPWFELMYNRGFEAPGLPGFGWAKSRATGIGNAGTPAAHGGSYKAGLGGNGSASTETLYQQVTIPAVATQATLSFWLHVASDETTNFLSNDDLTLELRSCSGTLLATLDSFSNLDEAAAWTAHSYDVSAYKGQTVRVYLKAVENATLKTTFTVDDFSLKVK